MRTLRRQWVQAPLGAPGQVATQIRFCALAGRALETGQVGSDRKPQAVGERIRRIGRYRRQMCEGRHTLTLQRPEVAVKADQPAPWPA